MFHFGSIFNKQRNSKPKTILLTIQASVTGQLIKVIASSLSSHSRGLTSLREAQTSADSFSAE